MDTDKLPPNAPGYRRDKRAVLKRQKAKMTAAQRKSQNYQRLKAENKAILKGMALQREEDTVRLDGLDWTKDQLVDLLAENNGNVAAVCRAMGLHRDTLMRLIEKHDIGPILHQIREIVKDNVEAVIHKKMLEGEESKMIMFYARTQMKERGYTTNDKVSSNSMPTININFIGPEKKMPKQVEDAEVIEAEYKKLNEHK